MIPDTGWLVEFAEAAEGSGFDVLPTGWHSLDPQRQLETAALALCRLKRQADAGEHTATEFFRLFRQWQAPPALPKEGSHLVRVGFLTPAMTFPGGAERWIQMLVQHRDPRIHWAGVAISGKHRDWESVRELEYHCPVLVGVKACPMLARECDVVVVWGVDEPRYLIPEFRGSIVAVSHGCGSWSVECLRTSDRWCDVPMAVSVPAAASFPDSLAARCSVVWNGVDPAAVEPQQGGEWFREQAGVRPGTRTVAYIGRYSWEKTPTAAARAAAALGPDWQALYVGDGWKAPQVTDAVRRIAPDAAIHPRVSHVGDALAASDVFVLASPAEGMSLGLIEAWMAGVPVVATRVGAVPELEERFGQLVTPVRVHAGRQELADACRAAVSPAGRRVALRAREAAREHLGASAMAARYCDAFSAIKESTACDATRRW